MSYDLIAIGIPYFDQVINVPDSVIAQYDLPKGGTGTMPLNACKALAQKYGAAECCGGPTANTLAGFTALGGRAAHVGVLANDHAGNITRANLAERGIAHLHDSVRAELTSPIIYALVTPDGERTFVTFKNSAEDILPHEVPQNMGTLGRALLCQIRFILRGDLLPIFGPAFNAARAAGHTVALSLQAFISDTPYSGAIRTAVNDYATLVFANENELKEFFQTTDARAALQDLPASNATVYVMTHGAKGVTVRTATGCAFYTGIPVDTVVDAIGAGDQFAAGFLYGLLHDLPVAESVALGQACAREILGIVGGQPPTGTSWQHLIARVA